jgi:hypothetical protein
MPQRQAAKLFGRSCYRLRCWRWESVRWRYFAKTCLDAEGSRHTSASLLVLPRFISISIYECETVSMSGDRSCRIHAAAALPNPSRILLRRQGRRLRPKRPPNSRLLNRQKANAATTSPQRAKRAVVAVAKPRLFVKEIAITGGLFLLPVGVGSRP